LDKLINYLLLGIFSQKCLHIRQIGDIQGHKNISILQSEKFPKKMMAFSRASEAKAANMA
jgi:hypothetical protein